MSGNGGPEHGGNGTPGQLERQNRLLQLKEKRALLQRQMEKLQSRSPASRRRSPLQLRRHSPASAAPLAGQSARHRIGSNFEQRLAAQVVGPAITPAKTSEAMTRRSKSYHSMSSLDAANSMRRSRRRARSFSPPRGESNVNGEVSNPRSLAYRNRRTRSSKQAGDLVLSKAQPTVNAGADGETANSSSPSGTGTLHQITAAKRIGE